MDKQPWTSRRRVEAALSHREPDRVPYDLGGTILTGIHRCAYRHLRCYLGLPTELVEIEDRIQQLARVREDLKQLFRVDVYGVNPGSRAALAGPPPQNIVAMWETLREHGI